MKIKFKMIQFPQTKVQKKKIENKIYEFLKKKKNHKQSR